MLKVTAYCRVSTDSEDQSNSFENQRDYFEDYISRHPDWQYVPLYADKGISGTQIKKREKFNEMITDAEAGKFDLILTKSVTRAFRNAVDALTISRQLRNKGVYIHFISDGIDTRNDDYELRLGIMASIAQEESRQTSERVKWGQKRSMEKGVAFGNTTLGYKIVTIDGKKGQLVINPDEAETIRLIFNMYLNEQMGLTAIARELENTGKLTGYGRKRWDATAVKRILENERYCGDLKQGKFYTPDYLTHKSIRNKGEKEFVSRSNNHEAIIEREVFDKVQEEIKRRGVMEKDGKRYTSRYPFSGKLLCGLCDASFVSRNRKANDGIRDIRRWQCSRYFKYGAKQNDDRGCENSMIRNEVLEYVFNFALNDAIEHKDTIIDECVQLLSSVLDAEQIQTDHTNVANEINRLNARIERLIDLRADGEITKDELKRKREPLDIQILALNEKLDQLNKNAALIDEYDVLLDEIRNHISSIVYAETFSGDVAKEVLNRIVIYGKNKFDVYFNGTGGKYTLANEVDKGVCNSLPMLV